MLVATLGLVPFGASAVVVGQLRCEYLHDPLGLDVVQPRLSWVLGPDKHSARGQRQSAYQVIVASNLNGLQDSQGDVWDSGKVVSDQSINVPCAGKQLRSGQECYWQVRVWDEQDQPLAWSAPGHWTMGLLKPSDWHAKWIGLDEAETGWVGAKMLGPAGMVPRGKISGPEDRRLPARMLRREFVVEKQVRRATAYVCGLGLTRVLPQWREGRATRFSPRP